MTHTVRTTFRPDQPIEVEDTEYAQLKTEGLLVNDPEPDSAAAPTTAPATTKKTPSGTTGSKEN